MATPSSPRASRVLDLGPAVAGALLGHGDEARIEPRARPAGSFSISRAAAGNQVRAKMLAGPATGGSTPRSGRPSPRAPRRPRRTRPAPRGRPRRTQVGAGGDPQPGDAALEPDPIVAPVGRQRVPVAQVGPADHGQHQGRVLDGAGHRPEMGDGAERRQRPGRDAAESGLQADDAGEAGRDADRAAAGAQEQAPRPPPTAGPPLEPPGVRARPTGCGRHGRAGCR